MTLESIYYVGQTIAVVVIVATLVAIVYQGYQTNKIARADLTLTMWMHTGAAHYSFVDSPEKADFMHRALNDGGSLTEPEKLRQKGGIEPHVSAEPPRPEMVAHSA
jgi:hypothetical protein